MNVYIAWIKSPVIRPDIVDDGGMEWREGIMVEISRQLGYHPLLNYVL